MSRIGKKPVPVVAPAKVSVNGQTVRVEGPKGKLEITVHPAITVAMGEGNKEVVVTRKDDLRLSKALHGLTRAMINNMVVGVTQGYRKALEIQGVGYKVEMKGTNLVFSVGYANQIVLPIPPQLKVETDGLKIAITGCDKQLVGQFAADVRRVREPEPYKGKGIRFEGEVIKLKPGKAVTGAGAK